MEVIVWDNHTIELEVDIRVSGATPCAKARVWTFNASECDSIG